MVDDVANFCVWGGQSFVLIEGSVLPPFEGNRLGFSHLVRYLLARDESHSDF